MPKGACTQGGVIHIWRLRSRLIREGQTYSRRISHKMRGPVKTKLPDANDAAVLGIGTVLLWILAAILEGIDLQSAGIAAPGIAREFGFDAPQMGRVFSSGTAALVVSAVVGGRLADRFGRKRVLIAAIAVYGVFSLSTAFVWNYESLLCARALTGLGLGAAIPNLVALVAESSPQRLRNRALGLMYCGMPLGSALIALVGWVGLGNHGWRIICYAGGVAPLIVAPILSRHLKESPVFVVDAVAGTLIRAVPTERDQRLTTTLFRERRALITTTLWLASFCTYFVLYLLLSWLPTLLVNRGLSASVASGILILFNLGGVAGVVVSGMLMDLYSSHRATWVLYTGLIVVLLLLSRVMQAEVIQIWPLLVCAFAADFFAASSQIIQYGLGSLYYDDSRRGSGVGAMVAVGRTGAIAGPYLAGQLLASGWGAGVIVGSGVPGLLISSILLLVLSMRANAAPKLP